MKLPSLLRKMKQDWDGRARQCARHYIATARADWTDEEFIESGRATIRQYVLNDMWNICRGREPSQIRALEVGCGAGRSTKALAEVFGEVHGVDVSGEMINAARSLLRDQSNAFVYQNNGMDLSALTGDLSFAFAFSHLVFQHIPSQEIIENYFHEVSRRLEPGALFKCQVNGCMGQPRRLSRLIRNDTWLGTPLSEAEVNGIAERSGFEPRYLVGAGTQDFWLWFFKRPTTP